MQVKFLVGHSCQMAASGELKHDVVYLFDKLRLLFQDANKVQIIKKQTFIAFLVSCTFSWPLQAGNTELG